MNKNVTVITGAFWGDEGKGRSAFFESSDAKLCIRATGGANAGHTIYTNGKKFTLHLVPGGIINPQTICLIEAGVVVDLDLLIEEINELENNGIQVDGRLFISKAAHIVLPLHKKADQLHEELKNNKVGTTGRGIGPTYADKASRIGLRMEDLTLSSSELITKVKNLVEYHNKIFKSYCYHTYDYREILCDLLKKSHKIKKFITNTRSITNITIKESSKIVIEGAQAYRLDLEHGDYPYVTSSYCNTSGTLSGAGIGPIYVKDVIGITKSYCTRVGEGPFPTEIESEEISDTIRNLGHEYGATTGRPRRIGWLDLTIINEAKTLMGYTALAVNHLDTLGKIIKEIGFAKVKISSKETVILTEAWNTNDCKNFSDLPKPAQEFIELIETTTDLPVRYIGIGPDNKETIIK